MKPILLLLLTFIVFEVSAQQLYQMPANAKSRLSSFENPDGVKGNGGKTNKTAKGNAFEWMKPGETKILLNTNGEGTVQRIWLTIDQNPVKLRSLRLQMFWDGATKPAVDVPLGDFFCNNLGKKIAFQSALFSSGEGRSFNCYIPMPFRKSAKILLVNEGKETVMLFYDVDFVLGKVPADALYFHAYWARQNNDKLGDDFVILPKVNGKGRFLGLSAGLNADPLYGQTWWGEGEVKMYMDGDTKYPTINGTGSEDYIGSAWGLGTFTNLYQGCTLASDSLKQFVFYRLHIPDAIYFNSDIKVVIQQIGGGDTKTVRDLINKGVNLKPITVALPDSFIRLFESPATPPVTDEKFPEGWVNFYRVDDYSSVSYFYLDKASSNLPPLAPLDVRTKDVK
ncbi:MAG: glycoside hydrolase family 172 protein [Bacteroidota bacterium]